ncbi:MAG: nonstructural protein [Microvirus sp.]|nr:MAG: nonstructural protein [Microvirus sp.]
MIRLVVAVRDGALGLFGQPWFVVSRGQAIRAFTDEVNRKPADTDLAKHPEDFELFAVAEYDESTGRFGGLGDPEPLIRAKDCVNTEQ